MDVRFPWMGMLREQHVVGLPTFGLGVGAWFPSVPMGEALHAWDVAACTCLSLLVCANRKGPRPPKALQSGAKSKDCMGEGARYEESSAPQAPSKFRRFYKLGHWCVTKAAIQKKRKEP